MDDFLIGWILNLISKKSFFFMQIKLIFTPHMFCKIIHDNYRFIKNILIIMYIFTHLIKLIQMPWI